MDVSIIITTYNRLWCLPKAIESCRNTNCKTQIIVVDDGSTDGTFAWLQTQQDILSFYQPNQGQTYAINKGVSLVKSKYVRFLDSDDFLAHGTIDKQFELAEHENADVVVSNIAEFDYNNQKIFSTYNDDLNWNDFMEVQLSNSYGSHFLAMMFKTETVLKVPRRPDFANREDRMFLLEIALLEPKVSYLNEVGGYWVKHSDQMQANYQGLKSVATNWQHLNIFKKILNTLEIQNELTQHRKNAACTSLWPLAHWIAKSHLKEAVGVAKWIDKLNPAFQIPEKGILGLLYRKLGFETTEKILALRRILKYGLFS